MTDEDKIRKKRKEMFNEAFQYLKKLGKEDVFLKEMGKEDGINEIIIEMIIERHLKDWKFRKPEKMDGRYGLFYNMINHTTNRQGMNNVINLDCCKKALFKYNHYEVLRIYGSNNEAWKKVFVNFETIFDLEGVNREKGIVVDFCRSIISIAKFLSKFNTIDEFYNYVDSFDKNDDKRIELALILAKIDGYGFALACDFLKENCNPNYVKPDTHIIKLFTNRDIVGILGIEKISQQLSEKTTRIERYKKLSKENKKKEKKESYSTKDQIEVFKAVRDYSASVDELAYEVDKLFWLVGSGYFYLLPGRTQKDKTIKTDMDKFIKRVGDKFSSGSDSNA